MFVTRLISGVVLVAAAILLFFFGDIWLVTAMGLLSLLGSYEMLRVFQLEKHPLGIVTYVATVGYYVLLYYDWTNWAIGLMVPPALLALLAIYVVKYPKYRIEQVTKAFFTFLYVSVLLSFVYQIRCMTDGEWLVWLVLIGSWGSDTCAYCVGKLIGKHHFSELSPKKTIEGCVGGVLGAGLIALIYAFYFSQNHVQNAMTVIDNSYFVFPAIVIICAVISQIGDLAASAIKRNCDVKDYGTIIPGHGGVLDRFDSVIFVAPFVYYLLIITEIIL